MSVCAQTCNQSQENQLLAALPLEAQQRIYPHLKRVPMPLGMSLYEPGDVMSSVYFPADCIVSLQCVLRDGSSTEIALVGNDGLIGISLFLGGESTSGRAVVRNAGRAYQMSRKLLKEEFDGLGQLHFLVLLYAQALIAQMAQTAMCNRHHSVEQQLCRWLLASLDRLPGSNELNMTQELIADMLGVRREGVTASAGKLQEIGAIRYSRGKIVILDREKLERTCCECYAVVKRESERLLRAGQQ